MSSEEKQSGSLVNINLGSDVLGLGEAGRALVNAIAHGVGPHWHSWMRSLAHRRELKAFGDWKRSLGSSGLALTHADVTLGERVEARLVADAERFQCNREGVGAAAIEEFKHLPPPEAGPSAAENVIDPDWLDRFWRIADGINGERMQSLWGRVLARRSVGLLGPSPRVLEFISLLDGGEIDAIERIAPNIVAARTGSGTTTSGIPYGVGTYEERLHQRIAECIGSSYIEVLGPIGFYINPELWAGIKIEMPFDGECYRIAIGGGPYRLMARNPATPPPSCHTLGLSPIAREVISLVPSEPNSRLVAALQEGWKLEGYDLIPD